MDTLENIRNELRSRKGDWGVIASEAGVSYSWLTKFANNKIPNPGVITIERLDGILKRAA